MGESDAGFFVSFLRSVFGFRKTTLSFLVILSYLASILVTEYYEKRALIVPYPEPAILSSSWLDLQEISRLPHPYGSHANDDVHDYILHRVKALSKEQEFIEFDDDFGSKSVFKQIDVFNSLNAANRIIYFESGNILVKIQGKNPSLEGILISAHYDSVPSAYGVTDDGMGIASMLGILEHFATTGEQPLRNIVFNFNNDEEFGLLGASVFFDHKWSKLVKYFVNLEGTGAGGRAILFRATDHGVAQYYNTVRSPFGNSLYQQGFQSGLIRSETDYKIYLENGMRGVDIAFYKPRNLYHTPFDSIQGSSKGSLWHMMSNALDMLVTLSSTEGISTDSSPSLFFDILGLTFFSISVDTLFIYNVAILTVVPVISLILLLIISRRGTWFVGLAQGWLRFPIALVASVLGTWTVLNVISAVNPLILGSDWFSVLICSTCVFILINYLVINFFSWWMPVHDQKLIMLLELSFVLWMLLIFATVRQHQDGLSGEYAISVIYLLSSISTIFGLLALVFKSKPKYKSTAKSYGSIHSVKSNNNLPTPISPGHSTTDLSGEQPADTEDAGETEPLLLHSLDLEEGTTTELESSYHPDPEDSEESFNQKLKSSALKSFSYDWSIQFLIFVPLTIFIAYDLGELLIQGLNYTAQEGNALVTSTFKLLSYIAILLGLPLLPFIHKLNFFLFLIVAIGAVIGMLISISQSPVSANNRLKVSFLQMIDLTKDADDSFAVLSSRAEYLEDVVSQLPSVVASESKANCTLDLNGRASCIIDALRPWLVDGTVKENKFSNYLDIEVIQNDNNDTTGDAKPSPYAPLSAELKIWAPDNRNCVIDFNTTKYSSDKKASDKSLVSPVKTLYIYHDSDDYGVAPNVSLVERQTTIPNYHTDNDAYVKIPSGPSYDPEEKVHRFKLMSGIDNFQLHKVNFSAPYYHIGLEWMPNFEFLSDDADLEADDNSLGISVSCFWGEFQSESIIDDGEGHMSVKRKLPAFDELLHFAPDYVAVSNAAKGLLVVKNYVEL